MSIIQGIRDKYARVSVIAIAVALIGFILTDYISGRSRNLFSGGNSNLVGRVNGTKISRTDFDEKVKQQEEYAKSQGYGGGDAAHQGAIDMVWNQEVEKALVSSEVSELGMGVGKRELNDIIFGPNSAPEDIKKAGTDPQTGIYNPTIAQQEVNRVKRKWTPEQKAQFNQYLTEMEYRRLKDKYTSLMTGSVNFPRWMIEKENADNSLMAKISFVRESYTEIPDSTVKVTDKEISDYISKHKEDYKQTESRSISYVRFSALPTAGDSIIARNDLETLKPEFDTTHDAAGFLNRNSSELPYYDGYAGKSQLNQLPYKDSILKLSVNQVFGPYQDRSNFVMAKMIEIRQLPDSVQSRHILLGTTGRDGSFIMEDSVAHHIADSVALAIKNGANFDTLETKISTDRVSHEKKGVMTFKTSDIQSGGVAKEYGDFILYGKTGDKKVVHTSFGWHYIEILTQYSPEPYYKVAYMAKAIEPSKETDDNARSAATDFAGKVHNEKEFNEVIEKELKAKKINKAIALDIAPNAYEILGLGVSRAFVKEIYEAKLGQVLLSDGVIGSDYVVAVITEINPEGTMSVAKARPKIEPILRNEKKTALIKQKIGKITTLEAAGVAMGGKQIETADSLRMTGMAKTITGPLGYEARLNGAAFNPANKGKVVPEALAGVNGVYVIRVDDVTATPTSNTPVADERRNRYLQSKMGMMYNNSNPTLDALREAASISDKRASQNL